MDELLCSVISTLTVKREGVNEQPCIDSQRQLSELVPEITGKTSKRSLSGYLKDISVL